MNHTSLMDSRKFLSVDEDERVRVCLSKDSSRDALMLSLLRRYGMRAGELLLLRKKDIMIASRSFYVRGLKGSLDRELPLPVDLFLRLMDERDRCGDDDGLVFPISVRRLQYIWHFYRPVDKKLHCLRHTCAVRLYEQTKDLKLVQRVLGHKYMSSTLVYQDFFYTQGRLREVLVGG